MPATRNSVGSTTTNYELVPAAALALRCFLIAGWSGLVVGFVWSTVLLYHATFCINSLAQLHGRRRYVTGDESRNNWLLTLITMGEGWHNNHHAFQRSVRQGFRWWEVDMTFYILKALSLTNLVWNLKSPAAAILRNEHRLGARVIELAARRLAESFNPDAITASIRGALAGAKFADLQTRLSALKIQKPDLITELSAVLPTRSDILQRARSMYVQTASLDTIVDRAQLLLLEAVGVRLKAATA